MKQVLLLAFVLTACHNTTTLQPAVDTINTSIDVLNESIPKECKSKLIEMQIAGLKQQVVTIEKSCESDIKVIRADKIKWQCAFFCLAIIVLVYFLRKIIK